MRDRTVEHPCPACRQLGVTGEYGASCENDKCRVVFYRPEDPNSYRWGN